MEFIILVAVIFSILFIYSLRPNSSKKSQQEPLYNVTETITTRQFMETIDLMRDKNIITTQQHIDYMIKMNAFLK